VKREGPRVLVRRPHKESKKGVPLENWQTRKGKRNRVTWKEKGVWFCTGQKAILVKVGIE